MSRDPEPLDFVKAFDDPEAAARYADGPRRFVPGFEAMHRMTAVLLAEKAPLDARIMVLGAGGGLELKALAEAHPGWTFVGVDPSKEMLLQAERVLGPLLDRVTLVHGYVDDAPAGPFDGATCLLTLHFLSAPDRERTVREIHRRLRRGAPFVAVHGSFPQESDERPLWLSRYEAYAVASGADPAMADRARSAVAASLHTLDPERDEEVLRQGGFRDVGQFFAAFTWRGWIATA